MGSILGRWQIRHLNSYSYIYGYLSIVYIYIYIVGSDVSFVAGLNTSAPSARADLVSSLTMVHPATVVSILCPCSEIWVTGFLIQRVEQIGRLKKRTLWF